MVKHLNRNDAFVKIELWYDVSLVVLESVLNFMTIHQLKLNEFVMHSDSLWIKLLNESNHLNIIRECVEILAFNWQMGNSQSPLHIQSKWIMLVNLITEFTKLQIMQINICHCSLDNISSFLNIIIKNWQQISKLKLRKQPILLKFGNDTDTVYLSSQEKSIKESFGRLFSVLTTIIVSLKIPVIFDIDVSLKFNKNKEDTLLPMMNDAFDKLSLILKEKYVNSGYKCKQYQTLSQPRIAMYFRQPRRLPDGQRIKLIFETATVLPRKVVGTKEIDLCGLWI